MIEKLNFKELDISTQQNTRGGFLGMDVIAAFAVLSMVTILVYKIFTSNSSNVSLPGGFKFKLT